MFEPSTKLRSRAWVEVDLDAMCDNAERMRRAAGPTAALLPMVKADAYGLGMRAVAGALAASLPAESLAGFGVAAVAEGEALREAGWAGRIVVIAPVAPGEYTRAAAARLVLCLSDLAAVERWAEEAATRGRVLPMHVEVDTGMGRAGFAWDQASSWAPAVARLAAGRLSWEGCFTHFHSADEADLAPTELQWTRFETATRHLPASESGARPLLHVANSAAALRCRFPCDWVRPGIFLYGGRVGADPPSAVAALRARLVRITQVEPGTTVGYGATYVARDAERWGTLAIGYGDGLPRALGSAGGSALLRGRRVPIRGRISMDLTVVDLTELPDAAIGDVATLIGRDGGEEITVDEVAARVGTISYEVLTGLRPRLPRVYLGDRHGGF